MISFNIVNFNTKCPIIRILLNKDLTIRHIIFKIKNNDTEKNMHDEIDRCPNDEWIGVIGEMEPNGAFSVHIHVRNVGEVNLECDVPFNETLTNEIIKMNAITATDASVKDR